MKAKINEDGSKLEMEFEETGEGTTFFLLLQNGIYDSEELLETDDGDINEVLENWMSFVW